ncbi:MAG: MarR family transcriptional regulator [Planktomarina sp.]|jgi:homoprotocatechuate degradation regulator HpaR|nr:MarR family transcriptional regulator [Planktomarina sp.]|tara:strand:- start:3 stop:449 length:447 start_codon:yes stop_codon:yes gene_type:complete
MKTKKEDLFKRLPSTRRSLPIALMRSREKVMGPIRDMLKVSGITEQQWRVLRVLSESGAQDLTQISLKASLLMPSLSRIIKKLREEGLIVSQTNDEDRRRQIVRIGTKGQKIIDDNLPQAMKIAEELQQHLGLERHEQLLDLLETLEK